MCGIAGIIDYRGQFGANLLQKTATKMRETMVHRGPDSGGTWGDADGNCALSHRRLSILDLSEAGHQPMVSANGKAILTFNGEIYNYVELRQALQASGSAFHTDTDSEVLLELLKNLDPAKISQLDGMFAFGIWYPDTKKLLIARDPFGEKPLYFTHGDGWFGFASELQALERIPAYRAEIDTDSVAQYLLLQYIHAPRTIYKRTYKLLPGTWKIFDFSQNTVQETEGKYFSFSSGSEHTFFDKTAPPAKPARISLNQATEQLRQILIETVASRLRSDVPLGIFLSGGIDSTLIAAIAKKELGVPVQSFSMGFENSSESEHEFARQIAAHLGTEHRDQVLTPNALEWLPKIAQALDEPLGDTSCLPTYLLSSFTRQYVTVALSGDGGDELFGGYTRYQITLREANDWIMRLRYFVRHRQFWNAGAAYCGPRWLMFYPEVHRQILPQEFASFADDAVSDWIGLLNDPAVPLIHRMRQLDANTYLPGAVLAKVDRMSMRFSLEVRAPFLGRRVADFAATLSPNRCYQKMVMKIMLRNLAERYVPQIHSKRKKMGFGLPGGAWSCDAMMQQAEALLLSKDSRCLDYLAFDGLKAYLQQQRSQHSFSIYQIWTLLILETWLRQRDGDMELPGIKGVS